MIYVEPAGASRKDMRKTIISRDRYKCCATGRIDIDIVDLYPTHKDAVPKESLNTGNLDSLQVAHVFPYAFNKFDDRDKTRVEKARLIWTAFRDFSGFKVEDLAGEKINGEGNLFMLAPVAHKLYDRLELWFELQDVSP
ncbi:hypothetical protein BDM02DRAFT_3193766 [Thelephora ganbajun]|uniref:Uncharacterized protein n=1 Tax=Thelephora ganbajun TaxID=370292 RepID=A0ACB6YY67_THEGA|nr:hypothetical protein BDM02DRAFT_3193766 [Thelephora ganbajun]